MTRLFILLAVIAGIIFLAAPFWVAMGYLVVLVWSAFLLYLIFYRPDPISRTVETYGVYKEGGAVSE
jgi:hypothetical protein